MKMRKLLENETTAAEDEIL